MQFSSLPINSSLQNNPKYQFSLKSENIEIFPILSVAILKIKMTLNAIFIITKFKMATITNQRWISIRNIIIYLETKFFPNRRIFVFWPPFWIQNGRHSKPKWSPYGAACLTSCKYPFPMKYFHFWIFNDFLNFYIGSHFEMAPILKIPRPECTSWDGDPPSCEV